MFIVGSFFSFQRCAMEVYYAYSMDTTTKREECPTRYMYARVYSSQKAVVDWILRMWPRHLAVGEDLTASSDTV